MRKLTLRFDDPKNGEAKYKKQITELNQRLVWWGVLDPLYAKDNNFSNKTLEAVCEFQEKKSLTIDGVVGARTWHELTQPSDSEVVEVINQCGENGCSIEPPEHENLEEGFKIIRYWEKLRLAVYPDPHTKGKPYTVGYGSTRTLDGKNGYLVKRLQNNTQKTCYRFKLRKSFYPNCAKFLIGLK